MARVIKLNRKWTLGPQIGGGGFGSVFEATDEGGLLAAIKLVPKRPGAERELQVAQDVSGLPRVVELLDFGEDGTDYALVMRRAERSLDTEIGLRGGTFPVDDALPILTDIAEGLASVHAKAVINRDVKPPNVLLIGGEWQVSDFGIARYAEVSTAVHTFKMAGSQPYTAPERWRGERATAASDMYSFGVLAHELLSGGLPFAGPDFADQHMRTPPPALAGVPPKLASLVIECLDKAPEARPTAANVLNRLRSMSNPASPGAASLQAANQVIAVASAEASTKLAAARSERERRAILADSGAKRLDQIVATLEGQIAESAPKSSVSTVKTATTGWAMSLGSATLYVDAVIAADRDVWGGYEPVFDVVAYASIGIRIPRDRFGWEGRAHALWFCDATEVGVFRWHETAFMMMPLMRQEPTIVPFALPPGGDSGVAIAPTTGHIQVAWPFTPFDQGDEGGFVDRWLEWFGEAALGNLHRPSSMPERPDAFNSWRK